MIWGANIHRRSEGSYATVPLATQMSLAADMCLGLLRVDVYDASADTKQWLGALLSAATPLGLTVTPVLVEPPLASTGSEAACYAWGFGTARSLAQTFPSITHWEAGNELNFRCVKPGVTGELTSHYDAARYRLCRGAIRGMHNGFKMGSGAQVAVGTAGIQWGFLDKLRNDGVSWDLTSWHIYMPPGTTDIAIGAPTLFAKLALYNKPIAITEFNQQDGHLSTSDPTTLVEMMTAIEANAVASNIIAAHLYELLDEPGLPGGEATYGLTTAGALNTLGAAVKQHINA